jgi:hypothetical protein
MGLKSHSPEGCYECEAYEERLMADTRKFKIVSANQLGYGLSHEFDEWRVYGVDTIFEDGVNAFPDGEWDMEVTFTKKAKPFNPGDIVHVEDSWYHQGGTVVTQYKDRVVVADSDDDLEIYDAADLVLS